MCMQINVPHKPSFPFFKTPLSYLLLLLDFHLKPPQMACVYALFLITFHLTTTCVNSKSLVFQLTHSLSNSSTDDHHHLLKSTTTHSSHRFLNHHRQVSLALSPGSDYTMSFSLGGSNSSVVTLYMDTGSDLVWVPCKPFTCIMCEGKSDPKTTPLPHDIYSSSASRVSCQSRACSSVHNNNVPSSHLCAMSRCPLDSIEMSDCQNYTCPSFYYAYGDGSFVGKLYQDVLRLPMSAPPSLTVENFTFGCAHEALGEPIGVAGFGRGPLSLPAQLAAYSPNLASQFSYCLISHSFDSNRLAQPSPLVLGRRVDSPEVNALNKVKNSQPFVYTPMLENTKHPYYYYVGLEAVTVGKKRITGPLNMRTIDGKGSGGMVVDSGTTYSMLPEELYNSVVGEFGKLGYKRAQAVEDKTGLSPCYYMDQPVVAGTTDVKKVSVVPQLVLHFGGNSSLVLPKKNYFYEFTDGKKVKRKVGCMTLMNAGYFPDSGGPAGLLGNYQQQGLEVVYDLLNKRVGFARRKCSSLWDTLG